MHRWLQRIADDELKGWNAKRVLSLRPIFAADLERRGVPRAEIEMASERVATALANTIADERGQWVLGAQVEAKSEYRIRTPDRALEIDRVFRDSEGKRWVVDFKTSSHEGGNVEAFLDQEAGRYRSQLHAYAAALGGAECALYFPMLRRWRIVA